MRIGLVYDLFDDYPWRPDEPPDADAEYEPEATVVVLEEALRSLGHTPVRLGTAYDLRIRRTFDVDAAVNIAEAAHGRNREGYAPTLLEMAGIPFLGSDALTLSLSLDKAWTKDLAVAAGLRTPAYRTYASPGEVGEVLPPGLAFPLFAKPCYEGSAKGVTADSKVGTMDDLRAQVEHLTAAYQQAVLVETFVDGGGEFTVAVVGNDPPEALPTLQRAVERDTRIGLHALEHRGAPERDWDYDLTGTLTPTLESEMHAMAIRIYDKLLCKDFARVDFRVDATGRPWFIEINPLPTFAPDGTFAIIAELMGRPYPAFLADLIQRGLRRLGLA